MVLTMKAIVQPAYGGPEVLQLREVERPSPKPNEVLVRVMASSVNRADWFMLTGTPFPLRFAVGLFKPTKPVAGIDVSGIVEAVGAAVSDLRVGDAVFGEGSQSWAEFSCVEAKRLAKKPDNVSFEHAATLPVAGVTALQGLKELANVQHGQRVLVNGAAGGVGTFAVQMAKALGAEVTAVTSARNEALVRSIGATHVIDYAQRNFSEGSERYDVIFDLVGTASISACRKRLEKTGMYISSVGSLGWIVRAGIASLLPGPRVAVLAAQNTRERLSGLADFVSRGLITPVIDRTFTLDEMQAALRYQGEFRTQGKCVVSIARHLNGRTVVADSARM